MLCVWRILYRLYHPNLLLISSFYRKNSWHVPWDTILLSILLLLQALHFFSTFLFTLLLPSSPLKTTNTKPTFNVQKEKYRILSSISTNHYEFLLTGKIFQRFSEVKVIVLNRSPLEFFVFRTLFLLSFDWMNFYSLILKRVLITWLAMWPSYVC